MGARGFEPGKERPIERPLARTEIAREKVAGRGAVRQARILEKAAVDETRRLGGFADRAAHASGLKLALAHLATRPARRALKPRGHGLGICEQIELEAGDGHLADSDRLASIGGDAGLQDRLIVADSVRALKLRRRCRCESAV